MIKLKWFVKKFFVLHVTIHFMRMLQYRTLYYNQGLTEIHLLMALS